jgi:nucleoside-diphosphate-sugar epimerase
VMIDLASISNDPAGEVFRELTVQVNHLARSRNAALARSAGVSRYILPSSCSVYGWQPPDVVCDEEHPINPQTTYARVNAAAEREILPLADDGFTVVVLRQATAYGLAPRMRFDLAINGMTHGAWHNARVPVLRDGRQCRPMTHVSDLARAQLFMLDVDASLVNGKVFNVGHQDANYEIGALARMIAESLPGEIQLEWYGDPDTRSYRVNFDRIGALGFVPCMNATEGALEVYDALQSGRVKRTLKTITLEWYRELVRTGVLQAEPLRV